ncbi:MAG: imidazole glycerol phosphate synthase subunit HisH, partial [Synergistaceae bacterium]|nr:imidazole glycerol phosphate synthase subunit HisH [Synergistaceae bacterium]
NSLHITQSGGVFANTHEGEHVYFVHSYSARCEDKYITATVEYGAELVAAVQRGNIYGVQFHPEKSGNVGLGILRAFCAL